MIKFTEWLSTEGLQIDPNHPIPTFQQMVNNAVANKAGVTDEIKKFYQDYPGYTKAFAGIIAKSGLKTMPSFNYGKTDDQSIGNAYGKSMDIQAQMAKIKARHQI